MDRIKSSVTAHRLECGMNYFRFRNRKGLRLTLSRRGRSPRGHEIRIRIGGPTFYILVALTIAVFMIFDPLQGDGVDDMVVSSIAMPICYRSGSSDCVVDGDTIRLGGEQIRLSTFNTPEIRGDCSRERQLARQAARRLSQILSAEPFTIMRNGRDKYGRTLATIVNSHGDVGEVLIREGLAHEWHGRRESWCV